MIEVLEAVLAGAAVGALSVIFLMWRVAADQARGRFALWRAEEVARVRRDAAAERRFALKTGLRATNGAPYGLLPFVPADVRFIGDPVGFVVFDGHSQVKDGAAESLSSVVFADVVDPRALPGRARLVAECVAAGRVRWETLALARQEERTSSSAPVSTS